MWGFLYFTLKKVIYYLSILRATFIGINQDHYIFLFSHFSFLIVTFMTGIINQIKKIHIFDHKFLPIQVH